MLTQVIGMRLTLGAYVLILIYINIFIGYKMLTNHTIQVNNSINMPRYNPISVHDILNNYEIHCREQQTERMLLMSRLRATGEILKRENLNTSGQGTLPRDNSCRYYPITKAEIEMERNRQLCLQQQAKIINCTTRSISRNLLWQPPYNYSYT